MRKILCLLSFLFFFSCIRIDTAKEPTKKQEYKGIITKIYQDSWKHGIWMFRIRSNKIEFEDNISVWPKSWEYAQVGDSIIKPADTLMLIIKKNDSTYQKFFYTF